MIPYLGDFVEDDVVYMMFNTFSSDDPSASCTITNLINTDVHIHKDSGLTQRNNAAGITVSVDFDGITGSHMIAIDTSDNTVAGFWVTGHDYFVRIEGTTIDAATINAVVGHFSIQNRYTRGTDSAALAATALSDATWTDAKAVHIDANISSRNATTPPTVAQIRTEMEGAGSKILAIEVDTDELQGNQAAWATATGFSTHSAADVWSVAARVLTANTNFNDLDAAAVKAEVVAALADIKLDHLLNIAVDTNWATTVHLDSVIGHMADIGAAATFDRTTDALEAIRNRGDAAWIAATGFSTHNAADVKTAIEAGGSHLALILADTNELELDWKNGGRLDLIIDIIAADTTTDIPAKILKYTQLLARSDAAIATDNATELTAINADGGSGAGDYSNQNDGIEAIRDRGDAAWSAAAGNPNVLIDTTIAAVTDQTHFTLTAGSDIDDAYKDQAVVVYDASNNDYPSVRKVSAYTGATKTVTLDSVPDFTILNGDGVKTFVTAPGTTAPTVGQVRAEMEGAGHFLDLIKDDTNELQTNQGAWLTATGFSVPNEYDAVIATLALEASLTAMKGATFVTVTDSLEAIRNRGDAAWITGGVAPTVEQIRTEMDDNSTKLAKIKSIVNFIRTKLL